MLKRVVPAAVVVLLAAALVPLRAEILEQVLVKVNGDILTKTEFERLQIAALRGRPELATGNPSDPELRKAVAEMTPDLILNAVDEVLLVQRGRELNYSLGDEQFNSIVANIKKQNNLADEAQFQAALKQEGLTMAELRRNMERSMLVQQVQRVDVMDKVGVTDDEARAYYAENSREFTTPAEITLREILIEVPTTDRGVNAAADDEAKAKADDLRKRLLAGEPFARLAGEFSNAGSRANGGLIGPLKSDDLAPQLAQLLLKMKVGELTEVQRTQRGYQILKLESRTEQKVRSFEDARGDISDKVAEGKFQTARNSYLDRLREQATITWRNTELKRAYEQGLLKRGSALAAPPQAGQAPPAVREVMSAPQWYALWTRSRHEQVVREQLQQKQIEAFLPTVTKWSRWKDRKKKIDWPLFPGYCFARFDAAERLPILKCTGVVNIISFEGEPAPIPQIEIDGIRQLVESDLAFDPCPMIREGMMVEVLHGPLKGVVGRLLRKNEKARLVLSVDLIGQAVSVEVDAADVRQY